MIGRKILKWEKLMVRLIRVKTTGVKFVGEWV